MQSVDDTASATSPRPRDARSSRCWRWAWRACRVAILAYLLVVVAAMFLETSLIYFPLAYPEGVWQPAGLPVEDACFHADDGTSLHGWYVPSDKPKAAVLFCHGNGGNITHRVHALQMLHNCSGASVLCFDYRGYGRSQGKPSEAGVLADARAARRGWLPAKRFPNPKSCCWASRSAAPWRSTWRPTTAPGR